MSQTETTKAAPTDLEQRLHTLEDRLGQLEAALGIAPPDQLSPARELTIAQAAAILRVSEEYFARLIDQDVIPSGQQGSERVVALTDVLQHRHERRAALQRLAELSEEYGLYEDEASADDPGRP